MPIKAGRKDGRKTGDGLFEVWLWNLGFRGRC